MLFENQNLTITQVLNLMIQRYTWLEIVDRLLSLAEDDLELLEGHSSAEQLKQLVLALEATRSACVKLGIPNEQQEYGKRIEPIEHPQAARAAA